MPQETAICTLPFYPVRAEPRQGSEMVSMLLWGELFQVIENHKNWYKIECLHDNYSGWVSLRKVYNVDDDFLKTYQSEPPVFVSARPAYAFFDEEKYLLSPGSRLPMYKDNTFQILDKTYNLRGMAEWVRPLSSIIETAKIFLGAPYLWGGRSIFGIDCSGFTQVVFGMHGIPLLRDAWQQAEYGITVENIADAKAGDLAFFAENGHKITHVGILTGDGHIIHASYSVRMDRMDGSEIFNLEIQEHTWPVKLIKRYI